MRVRSEKIKAGELFFSPGMGEGSRAGASGLQTPDPPRREKGSEYFGGGISAGYSKSEKTASCGEETNRGRGGKTLLVGRIVSPLSTGTERAPPALSLRFVVVRFCRVSLEQWRTHLHLHLVALEQGANESQALTARGEGGCSHDVMSRMYIFFRLLPSTAPARAVPAPRLLSYPPTMS